MTTIIERPQNKDVYNEVIRLGFSPFQADIVSRRIQDVEQVDTVITPRLAHVPHPFLLHDCDKGAKRIIKALQSAENIALITDYDVDGLTSHAIMVHSFLEHFFLPQERLSRFVGHRHDDGYGVTDSMVAKILAQSPRPDLLITADCGSSDQTRLAMLAEYMDVIVTDHHLLPVDNLPSSAYAVVNPHQPECQYPDKAIAGCMVCWLLMSRVRTMLVEENILLEQAPKLGNLLDFVALGTVADSMSLQSGVNRAVVRAGLQVCQTGGRPCWAAISSLLGKKKERLGVDDFGFQIGPRINAASRMGDPVDAANFLLAEDGREANRAVQFLDELNGQRKDAEQDALQLCEKFLDASTLPAIIIISHPQFHPGILGIVASRLVDQFNRPAIVATPQKDTPNTLLASGRSVAGLDLRAILAKVEQEDTENGLLAYGGHAAAVGLKIQLDQLESFKIQTQAIVADLLSAKEDTVIQVDGSLDPYLLQVDTIEEMNRLAPFGRGFETPCFNGLFTVTAFRFVGQDKNHLSLTMRAAGQQVKAIWFRCGSADLEFLHKGVSVQACYEMSENEFRGKVSLQLLIRALCEA